MGGMIEAPTLLLLAGVLLFTMTLFRMGRRKKPAPQVSPVPTLAAAAKSSQITDDLEVRLYKTFRELNARLETKTHVLNDLLAEAEGKIRRLEQLTERSAATQPVIIGMDQAATNGPASSGERFGEIYQLADRGMTPAEIAQRVDQPIGEIQLILGLRKRRKSG